MRLFAVVLLLVFALVWVMAAGAQEGETPVDPIDADSILSNLVIYPICEQGWQIYNFNEFAVKLDWYYQTFDDHGSDQSSDWEWPMVKGGSFAIDGGSQEEPSVTDFAAPHGFDINVTVQGEPTLPGGSGYQHEEAACPEDFKPRFRLEAPVDDQPDQGSGDAGGVPVDEPTGCQGVLGSILLPGPEPFTGGTFTVNLDGGPEIPVGGVVGTDGKVDAIFCAESWVEGTTYQGFVDNRYHVVTFVSGTWPNVEILWLDETRFSR